MNTASLRGRFCPFVLTIACVFAGPVRTNAADPIRFRGGAAPQGAKTTTEVRDALTNLGARTDQRHIVVQFDSPLTRGQRVELATLGLDLLGYLGNNGYFAAIAPGRLNADAITAKQIVVNARPIETRMRLHPFLADGHVPEWVVVSRKDPTGKPGLQGDAADDAQAGEIVVAVYVLFHADVELSRRAVNTALRHGAKVRSHLKTVNGLVIELPFANIPALADEDAVQWVEPALPKFSELNDSNRQLTGAEIVQAAPYNLDGSGVTVLVYDGGTARASHVDFGGRLTIRDTSGMSDHSTHVAATVGGDGTASGGVFRGMAPAVTIESYGFETAGGGPLNPGFLYTDPGDIEADYGEAINTYGAAVANSSIGTNTAPNGFPCEWEGNYGVTSAVIDSIVRGSLGAPMRIVWANGNERQGSAVCGSTYHTTAPPACAKNHITVGAVNSDDDSVTSFTSWGPADDGRLKPDVSAPGCQGSDDFDVTSASSSGDTAYTGKCGTSMAAPTVTGLAALLLQDFRAQHPADPDFRNSTLKAVLAHTAQDLVNPGPDYQTGYGSVRVQPAIDLMRSDNFLEDEVSQGTVYAALALVSGTDTQLKVTLAWDDSPGTPNVDPALVNDLDLVVFDPLGIQHFPWTLDPNSPASPAVQSQADHVNNIEQVTVDAPMPGAWRIEVRGFNVPQGPQPLSLTATPLLIACSTQGFVSLDRAKYACEGVATLQVVDCDLNTDDASVETVTVTIESDSEPLGETVILTETALETAAFLGTIPLSAAGLPSPDGVLKIVAGDTLTLRYIDADDGFGGMNVVVEDAAVVDCVPPNISSVQTGNIEPRSATVTFSTDELAQGAVFHGLSCAAATNETSSPAFATEHAFNLSGLQDDTTYFYSVRAQDEAANALTDDNGGVCYSFATPQIPDFFTEEFGTAIDLANLSVSFTPNGSVDFYVGCVDPIIALPTDPVGGTTLSFVTGGGATNNDDGFAQISLTGGSEVFMYGLGYPSIYAGSNGYITFNGGDTTYSETLAAHFAQPRISALFDDLNPGAGGTASWKQLADRVAVTWENVLEYSTSNQSTFQIEMFFDGSLRVNYLGVNVSGGIIAGLSEGLGVSADYFETDLSQMFSCGPQPPFAADQNVQTPVDTPLTIALPGFDDGLPDPPAALTFTITSLPTYALADAGDAHVILSGELPYLLANNGNQVIYAPDATFVGQDTFQYTTHDGGTPPDGGPSNVGTMTITVGGPAIVYNFPLDVDPGWSTTGQWAFGVPQGGGTGAGDPSSGNTGNNVYGYNLSGDYSNSMPKEYLTTTPIDCQSLIDVELRFWRWLGMESSTFDQAALEISTNGSVWTQIWSHSGGTFSESSWSQYSFDISNIADGQPNIQLRWVMGTTDVSITYPGWNIDDIEIWAIAPVADCNGNGIPDGDDIAGGTSDDCNANGIPDSCDLSNCPGLPACTDCNVNGIQDSCDIAGATSTDCDGNGTPDSCDLSNCAGSPACGDCNVNGIQDSCDIAGATSTDCDGNGTPDSCDLSNCAGLPACADCNVNGIQDACDIAGPTSQDVNGNQVPDECEVLAPEAPLAEDGLGIACTLNSECSNTAWCAGGVCYVPKNRYISIAANPANSGLRTARRVSIPSATAGVATVVGWVGPATLLTPADESPMRVASVQGTSQYTDWSALGGTVHVGDCEIRTGDGFVGQVYLIESIIEGANESDPVSYSAPLVLRTATKYGDMIGPLAFPGQSSAPDDAANFQDIFAAVARFQQVSPTASVIWLDLTPEVPDGVANFADIFGAVVGFQTAGAGYPFTADPCSCPGACP